jgi:protein-disulfide isomerase
MTNGNTVSRWLASISLKVVFEIIVLSTVLVASGLIVRELWARRPLTAQPPPFNLPKEPIALKDAPYKGSSEAKAVMIVFSDFQCPFCGSFARETLPAIERDFVDSGQLAIVFRNLPLERIHPLSFEAAAAGLCANKQGRFWKWHDVLFQTGLQSGRAAIGKSARVADLQYAQFDECLRASGSSAQVRAEVQYAESIGIRSTPAFLIGKKEGGTMTAMSFLSGARPIEEFKSAIDQVVAQVKDP